MKITVHAVHEITNIIEVDDDDLNFIPPTDSEENKSARETVAWIVQKTLGADHVNCTSLKYFITDE